MNVSVPAPMKEFVDSKVSSGMYGSASEFVREAIREKMEKEQRLHAARQELDAKLLEGMNDGPAVPYSDELFREKKEALIRRGAVAKGRK
jgi:antitoxin ParD1/3/4